MLYYGVFAKECVRSPDSDRNPRKEVQSEAWCEVSKGDSAEIQACSRTIDVEEAVEERGEEESTQSLGRITVAKLWCHGMGMYALWKDDAITGSCDLSTSYDQDFIGIESRFDGYRVYGTTLIFCGR